MDHIPFIDLQPLALAKCINEDENCLRSKDESWTTLAQEVRQVTGQIGFMQLINHGIPQEIIKDAFDQSKMFFESPEELKMKYEKPESKEIKDYYGYNKVGRENIKYLGQSTLEFRETFDWMEGRGVYPDQTELPQFVPTLTKFHKHCVSLAKTIYKLWAIGLGLDDEDFFTKKNKHWLDPWSSDGMTNLRLARYPQIPENLDFPPGTMRINEHCDINTITLLFQDDVGGLEVKTTEGKWIHLDPTPGSVICNTGTLLEFWTAGLFPATPHRIPLPPSDSEGRRRSRYSIAYFNGPDFAETMTPFKVVKTAEEEQRIANSGNTYSDHNESVGVMEKWGELLQKLQLVDPKDTFVKEGN